MRPSASRLVLIATALTTVTLVRSAHAEQSSLPPEIGYHYGEVEDARWGSMGGALRATGNGSTSVWGNPAGLTQAQVYHIGGLAQIWPEAHRQSYGAVVMDSVTSRLALGVGFVWSEQDPDGIKRQSQDGRLALAFPFSQAVSFGVTGRYLKLEQNGLGPLGSSYASGGLKDEAMLNTFSFDTGLRIAPTENVSIGILGSNLSNPGNGLQPTSLGGGIGVGSSDFSVEGDVLADFTTWDSTKIRGMAGAEFLAGDHFPVRAGYQYDAGPRTHAISGGFGYIDPTFSVSLGGRRTMGDYEATAIFFSLQYFVESSGLTRTPDASMY